MLLDGVARKRLLHMSGKNFNFTKQIFIFLNFTIVVLSNILFFVNSFSVELNQISKIKVILVKGVITNDVVGRATEIRFFYKRREEDDYAVYLPNFKLTARDPGNYGESTMITLPFAVEAKFVILGIVSYDDNPCLKFELMGCPVVPNEQLFLGYDNGFPICVDNEPPVFLNCPTFPIEVQKGPNGIMPVNFTVPFARDNSGTINIFYYYNFY